MDVGTIISLVLGVIAAVFSGFWLAAKGRLAKFKTLIKEGYDVIQVAVDAVGDDKLTAEEIAAIKKEAKEVVAAFKDLISKSA